MNAVTTFPVDTPATASVSQRGIELSWIVAFVLGWIAIDNVLVYGFLGFGLVGSVFLSLLVGGVVAALTRRTVARVPQPRVSGQTTLACIALAFAILALGGEGRIFYANADWQIRDAVLADMGTHAWPTVTAIGGLDHILRAPIGMYLKPALIGGASQLWRDIALLGCNAALLGAIFALASVLFSTAKARIAAFAVFFVFSGMDIVGTLIVLMSGSGASLDHLELWVDRSQFSSHITMAFWVPQHAMAGWLCAILVLLWRRGHVSVGPLFAAVPMLAIWSPLAIMGALPFLGMAAADTALKRQMRTNDVVISACAFVIAFGSLIYLRAGSSALVSRMTDMTPSQYVLVLLLEIVPFSLLFLSNWRSIGFGRTIPLIAVASLCFMPLYCIGEAIDFQMRASITPLAIMALGISQILSQPSPALGQARRVAIGLLAIGAVTPAMEVRRTLFLQPSPEPKCALIDAWHQQSGNIVSPNAYFAPPTALPQVLQSTPASRITPDTNVKCWDRPWATPRF